MLKTAEATSLGELSNDSRLADFEFSRVEYYQGDSWGQKEAGTASLDTLPQYHDVIKILCEYVKDQYFHYNLLT
ncbi:MAG TPA: hypothetical protein VKM55_24440 [Candidatus Lokiarchaeia archaeon]|nr:hypothetical protein [Candidatus Lokiarchaeia archaeon]